MMQLTNAKINLVLRKISKEQFCFDRASETTSGVTHGGKIICKQLASVSLDYQIIFGG